MADMMNDMQTGSRSMMGGVGHPFISWRSIIGGLVVGFFIYVILTALGVGIGGSSFMETPGTGFSRQAGTWASLWLMLSAGLSLFGAGYFAARVSRYITPRVGSAQGLVIASLFFGVLLFQVGSLLGWAGRALGTAAATQSALGVSAMQSSAVQDVIEDALGDLDLRSPAGTVVGGLFSRLMRGDVESARAYLAYQTRQTPDEVQSRFDDLRGQFQAAQVRAAEMGRQAVKTAGYGLFFIFLVGAVASVAGGALGSRQNVRKPFALDQGEGAYEFRPLPI